MEVNFQMTIRQKAVFGCLQAAHAQDFLLAIPIDGLGQHMSPVEYRTILKYRQMIPLFPADEICPVYRKACLDRFGEHAVHCRELPGFKYRHEFVRDVLFDVFKRAGISVKKEAPENFLTDPLEGRSTLRPADVLVYGWVEGKHACVDLTGVSPLVGLSNGDFTVGHAALKAASNKVAKHERACSDNQHAFIPFAFDTFGFLAPDAVNILQRIQRVMHSNVVSPRSVDVLFKIIGFAIQKGLAAQLVAPMSRTLSESSVVEAHQQWMIKYGRTYANSYELENRKKIFHENLEYIENFNNGGNKSYKLGLNPFSDLTSEEFIASHTGLKVPSELSSSKMESVTVPFNLNDDVPTNFDWRDQGVVTDVKDQGTCGNYI
ncbi:hypothetical protein TSUD_385360 [Trifolium subterraneum]|uniref:Cathepsin propeptide inhibitor domain-containing protein n=1 Tax=Trifolium subterraneum TaxID=3900 RepID=A0A2Z6PKK8_TRISU|nr:hypothetical protein TSUD_385360 [Trifolium subterraneum]